MPSLSPQTIMQTHENLFHNKYFFKAIRTRVYAVLYTTETITKQLL